MSISYYELALIILSWTATCQVYFLSIRPYIWSSPWLRIKMLPVFPMIIEGGIPPVRKYLLWLFKKHNMRYSCSKAIGFPVAGLPLNSVFDFSKALA